ncbi:MAG: hypothetical protein ACRYG4_16230 [Janthinobacterium lividum]
MARIEFSRPLTPGERDLAANVFGSALDPEPITLRRGKWFPFQPRSVIMAPDGHVWFHPKGIEWRDDFAAARVASRTLLVHELVHVWQHQSGIRLPLRRMPWARYDYLPLVPGKPFARYGIEQQACIVADAYLIGEGARVASAPPLDAYAALIPFARPTTVSTGGFASGSIRSPEMS